MDIFVIVIVVALLATGVAMFIGVTAMSSGGEVDRQVSTTLMWIRVGLQCLTIALLLAALFLR